MVLSKLRIRQDHVDIIFELRCPSRSIISLSSSRIQIAHQIVDSPFGQRLFRSSSFSFRYVRSNPAVSCWVQLHEVSVHSVTQPDEVPKKWLFHPGVNRFRIESDLHLWGCRHHIPRKSRTSEKANESLNSFLI